jgi:hypothetical protein
VSNDPLSNRPLRSRRKVRKEKPFSESGVAPVKKDRFSQERLRFAKYFNPAGGDTNPKRDKYLCGLCVFVVIGLLFSSEILWLRSLISIFSLLPTPKSLLIFLWFWPL